MRISVVNVPFQDKQISLGLSAVIPNYHFEQGAQRIAKATALGAGLQVIDVTICGEACMDELTLYGKTASVVSQLAADHRSTRRLRKIRIL